MVVPMTASTLRIEPGRSFPLGAHWTGNGVQFTLFSEHADRVHLCLFDRADGPETARIPLPECTNHVWHGFFPDLKPGQLYAYRLEGPYRPEDGHRFNPAKLLLDPYAKATSGPLRWDDALFGYKMNAGPEADLTPDDRDSAPFMPKCVVVDDAFDWEGVEKPHRPMRDIVIYEAQVRGFSRNWEVLPEGERGSYRALGSDAAIGYFKSLAVTAVELLPVHQFVHDRYLVDKGLSNYWGYNTLGFFAPHTAYAAASDPQEQVREFKEMVKNLHRAGIEVILDVVYNHTAEGNALGPTLSWRGIDNRSYYRLNGEAYRFTYDYSGCGNTPDSTHPFVLRMMLDSLRYWVTEMGVDGFRFDLATALAREGLNGVFNPRSSFLNAVRQDPTLAGVKLIAEPWDIGEGGYQVGGFPSRWSEWNGRYRDCVRRFWKGDHDCLGELAQRLAGSPDIYGPARRTAAASVNFVTAHDGFTLRDLVSYNEKHNEANGEENRDGDNSNNSWNCGAEGETDDEGVNRLRRRQQRNFLATLYLSRGVPMLNMGDECYRTQGGNNNGYCQDGPQAWLEWHREGDSRVLTEFTAKLADLRREMPELRQKTFPEMIWFDAAGHYMNGDAWKSYGGGGLWETEKGAAILYLHNGGEPGAYVLPGSADVEWEEVLTTVEETGFRGPERHGAGSSLVLEGRSLILLRLATGTFQEARIPAP